MAWTEEKKKEAFDMAYVGVADILSAADRVKLTAVFDDVEKWLTDSIEAAVLKNKDKWAESSAYNIFREKMEKFIKDVESEPAEVEEVSSLASSIALRKARPSLFPLASEERVERSQTRPGRVRMWHTARRS